MDDQELLPLVDRARAGDPDALDDLLRRLRPHVVRRCAVFLPYAQDAEEAAQEALLLVAQKLDTYSGRGSFGGWVTVVTSNTARQVYRSLRRRFDEQSRDVLPDAVDPRTTSVIAGTRIDLLEALEQLERTHPAAVEAFVLRDLGTLPYEEVAALTRAPLGTVKARIHAARREVREKLRDVDNFSGPAGI